MKYGEPVRNATVSLPDSIREEILNYIAKRKLELLNTFMASKNVQQSALDKAADQK